MIISFLKTNKLLIAVLSLLGSVAGVAFSVTDVATELEKRKRIKPKSSKP